MKKLEELEFTDDYMFGEVLKDPELCKGVLERLLKIRIERLEYPELQKRIKAGYEVKGVRLDVYIKDTDTVYDIELQNKRTDIGRRTRFYQSMIDSDNLLKGKDFRSLPQSLVIFICKHDPFDSGFPCYTFENLCIEDTSIKLDDKTKKLIYNAKGYENEPDVNLRAFMAFVATNKPSDDFTKKLYDRVAKIKRKERFMTEYKKMYIGFVDDIYRVREETRKEVTAQKAEEDAVALLKEGIPLETIARCIALPIEQVQKLAEKIKQEYIPSNNN